MSALIWSSDGHDYYWAYRNDWHDGNPFKVRRHGAGRKYWEAVYLDGTHVDNFTTMAAAKESCETWEPDPSLVPLLEQSQDSLSVASRDETSDVDEPAAAEPALPFVAVFREHLWDASGTPVTRSIKREALKNVATLAQMRATVEALMREQIAIARTGVANQWGGYRWGDEPETWSDIGQALGVSKQAAAARYGDKKA